jgi:hypothetical protein
MIYFNINVRNPRWWERFKNIKYWVGETPIKHKFWEIQIIKNDNLFQFEFEVTTQQDHAGLRLELGLLGYEIHFTFYDNRHWDYETRDWVVYDKENLL